MSVTDTTHTAESGHDSNGNSDHRRREARRAMGGGLVAILATLVLLVLVAGAVLVPRALVRGGNSPETSTPEALPAPEPGAPQATTVPDTAPGATATTVVASA